MSEERKNFNDELGMRLIAYIVLTVGSEGIPSGVLYSKLMAVGMNLLSYTCLLLALEKANIIVVKNHYATLTDYAKKILEESLKESENQKTPE